jgi:hypothetical protein
MIAYLGRRGRGKSKDLQRENASHIEYVRALRTAQALRTRLPAASDQPSTGTKKISLN